MRRHRARKQGLRQIGVAVAVPMPSGWRATGFGLAAGARGRM